jgi:hypothetical protein
MKPFLYLFSGALIAPGILLALFLWLVTDAARQTNLFKGIWHVFTNLLRMADWTIVFVIPLVIAWVALAFFPRYRIAGSSLTVVLALASIVEMLATAGPGKMWDGLWFPAMSLSGLMLAAWLIWSDAMAP